MGTTLFRRLAFAATLMIAMQNWVVADPPGDPGDGRTVLPNTRDTPSKYVGLLYYDDPRPAADRPETRGRIRSGTAFLVGDKHIVTCAHVITGNPYILQRDNEKPYPDKFPKKMYFAPGHHGPMVTPLDGPATPDSQPYGRYEVVNVTQIFSQFFTERIDPKFGDSPIGTYDLVVLELDRSTRPTVGGHFEFNHTFRNIIFNHAVLNVNVNVNGYDADRANTDLLAMNNERIALWQMTRIGRVPLAFEGNKMRLPYYQSNLTCKAYAGASGSPIWILQKDVPTVVGVVVKRDTVRDEAVGLLFAEVHTKFIQAGLQAR